MPKKSKLNYHHGNLREQLVSTALKHLRNEGVEQLSLRALQENLVFLKQRRIVTLSIKMHC